MRKLIAAFCLFLSTALVSVQTAQAANSSVGAIFDSIGGTTTIDRGGAIHSQARSIYSLGGGMVSFQGKKVSLLAADPPSFSAGCAGISWHFGGFAFISLDEIRQMVEAVAQASLGIAVDLAMQTLCPQCYAVMSKLRDMANMMRNAAADSCKVAQNFGKMLQDSGIFSSSGRVSDCSKTTSEAGKTSSWLDSMAGSACKLLSDAETELNALGDKTMDFLKFGKPATGKTPDREQLDLTGNVTYKALSALGYEDGVVKDLMLSLLGMSVIHPKSDVDCRTAFKGLSASAAADSKDKVVLTAAEKKILEGVLPEASPKRVEAAADEDGVTIADINTKTPTPGSGGATKGPTVCNAPPLLQDVADIGKLMMCGVNVNAEAETFAKNYMNGADVASQVKALSGTSIGTMCPPKANKDSVDPLLYTCRGNSGECSEPGMQRYSVLVAATPRNGYTGLAWMVGDALYRGVISVKNNTPLHDDTKRILNGSGWPLYRLLNMAAVYPGLATQLLDAYAATIANQYAMDTIDKVMRIGSQPSIDARGGRGVSFNNITVVREQIMNLVKLGDDKKNQILARLAEKRNLVDTILQVNKALQAEVIGQGLSGNNQLAVSIKRTAFVGPPAPPAP